VARDITLKCPKNAFAHIGQIETRFLVFNRNERLGKTGRLGSVTIHAVGRHNVLNALAAIGVGLGLGMKFSQISAGLKLFSGVRRRFQLRGNVSGIAVLEDYAHHPTEIGATLDAARLLRPRRVIAVFQPHLYSRTKFFYNDFARVLSKTDHLVVTRIYGAREKPMPGVSAVNIVKAVRARGHRSVEYIEDKEQIPEKLAGMLRRGDMVFFLGAGDIGRLSCKMVEMLRMQDRDSRQ
jgi:UDP-N-acetylmuramate--alanine ligase